MWNLRNYYGCRLKHIECHLLPMITSIFRSRWFVEREGFFGGRWNCSNHPKWGMAGRCDGLWPQMRHYVWCLYGSYRPPASCQKVPDDAVHCWNVGRSCDSVKHVLPVTLCSRMDEKKFLFQAIDHKVTSIQVPKDHLQHLPRHFHYCHPHFSIIMQVFVWFL